MGKAISAADALAALKIAVGLNPNANDAEVVSQQFFAADVNQDGRVSAADALAILKMAVHLEGAIEPSWAFMSSHASAELASTTNRNDVDWVTFDNSLQLLSNTSDVYAVLLGDVNGSFIA